MLVRRLTGDSNKTVAVTKDTKSPRVITPCAASRKASTIMSPTPNAISACTTGSVAALVLITFI